MLQLRWCATGLAAAGLAVVGGCGGPSNIIGTTAVVGASALSIVAIGRTPPDAIYSLVTGKDCSIVRLDQGKGYCRPIDPPPEVPAFCTRSLAYVNCWADPAGLPGRPTPVADSPLPTQEQEDYRLRTWP